MPKGNETTTKFKVDISELKKSMQEARKQVAYANSEFKAVSSSMDNWSKSSDGISAKLKQLKSNLDAQETVLREYEKTLEQVKKEYGENSAEALEYATKLNNQKAVVNKVKKEISGFEDALEGLSKEFDGMSNEVEEVTESLGDVGAEAENSGDGFTVLKGAVAEFAGNVLTQLVDGLKDAISSLVSFSDEADRAMNSFQASTGATAEEMAGFEETMKNIYNANYGESFEDIASAMGEVKRISGDIGADELEKMTTNALTMRDTFDFEVSESMRAVNSLMDQFGITADEAFNLLAQGAQAGLNQNGDLLDVINEYAVHFSGLGVSAEDMFNVLNAGAIEGVFSIDKMGDAMKEFGIRVKDGSDTTNKAFELLGLNATEMQTAFSKGGTEAEDAYWSVWKALNEIEDEVTRNTIGVNLFGTMWEDLGDTAITEAMGMTDAFNGTIDTMGEINDVKYDSVGEALQGIGRNIQTGVLMPIGDKLLPIISDLATKFKEWLDDPATQEGIKNLTDSVTQFIDNGLSFVKEFVNWFIENKDSVISGLIAIGAGFAVFQVASIIQAVVTAIQAFKLANEGATVAQALLNTVMGANPMIKIVGIILAVVTALVTFIATNEDARAKIGEIWDKITEKIAGFVESVKIFFTETVPAIFNSLVEWVKTNWQAILLFLINPFAGLFKYFYDNNGKFKEFVDTAINFIKELPVKVWTWLVNTINKVTTWRSNMITKAKETASNFIEKIIEFVRQLPEKVWTWLVNTVNKVITWNTNMVTKAREAGLNFINKVIEFVKQLPEKVQTWLTNVLSKVISWGTNLATKGKEAGQKLFNGIVETVKGLPEKFLSIGSDIVSGLWNGISDSIGGLYSNIKESLSGLVDKAKDALGIHSPSKVFADEVGKWIPEGIAVGITKNAQSTLNAIKDLTADSLGSARAGLSSGGTVSGAGTAVGSGVVNNFYQTINSPKQLSRLDIYRQSKNLLGYAGGGL